MRILGIDPGLQKTGWGIITQNSHKLSFVASGLIKTDARETLAMRLAHLHTSLSEVLSHFKPDCAGVEETFVNKSPTSTLKLGQARGVVLAVPAIHGLPVYEYGANVVKKTVVGAGHAHKNQVGMMIRTLLPASGKISADEADALAVAICHAHHGGMHAMKSAQLTPLPKRVKRA